MRRSGTSINMNINEIITNRALQKTENKPGDYGLIDPIYHAMYSSRPTTLFPPR